MTLKWWWKGGLSTHVPVPDGDKARTQLPSHQNHAEEWRNWVVSDENMGWGYFE